MKKFTFILIAMVISAVSFAQLTQLDASKIEKPMTNQNLSNDAKSAWIGGGFDNYYTGASVGDEFFIVGSAFTESVTGNEITKVKFYHELGTVSFTSGDVTFDNTEYTIRIYESPTLTGAYSAYGLYDLPIGTPVFTESVTLSAAESGTIYEHTLSTPYVINSNDYWISISFDNGLGAMRLAGPADENENVYYMYYNYESVNYAVTTDFGSAETPAFYALGISLYMDDGSSYVPQSDLTPKFLDVYPDATSYISDLTITESEDLSVYPIVVNNGPDSTTVNATYSATINGEELIAATELDLTTSSLTNGYYMPIISPDVAYTITASELDALSLPTTFDVCFTVTYSGTDAVEGNNTTCLTVTRGEATVTECDLEAVFMTSNTDVTPIASTLSITATDDITVFPAIANNGPDDANTTATIVVTFDGTEALNQSIDMTGLTNGSISPITTSGYLVTADDMNTMGLTGTFDVCMSVTYDGTDNVTDNNETCVTVTRGPVNVNTNIAGTISVFPNPANNVVNIANAENSNITVINMVGQVVSSTVANSNLVSINTSDLSEGTYLVRIANGTEVTTQKINVIR